MLMIFLGVLGVFVANLLLGYRTVIFLTNTEAQYPFTIPPSTITVLPVT